MMVAGEITAPKAAALPFLCSLSLLVVHWLAQYFYSWSLVTHTSEILGLYLIVHGTIMIGMYSLVRRDRQHCSYFRAVVRGLLGFPIGALVMAFGAIVLGAPVGIRYLTRTVYWSLLMSLFTFVPLTCTFGSSSADWHRILAHFKPEESLDALVSLPAYGSVIGAWIGAWPMPLDWERPWQEWPICVTYGAVAGYLVGALSSMVFVLIHGPVHVKED
ncbi:phosphatidylinositol-glycan biosynthesis class F protein [Phalaenopsis equestris]|uniref:phosphatidylinositol-glycan biosynthesis class F protein n=1 Tax=Phalaenopsis equestris TaxID=78828 RepID=UPI0009E25612|nr:phosphatidylinositol-glycan biosynthesis class F protein [Phalaenopsis equestris]XP_020578096.1 phosphatidylinositol-glycan biosynthesis class F protein [Phalaenopsis equestris]XP_020578097.1 phosphatidylinositol-glycan biosynthesis class F protein [Phalaenopsis equestris]XP_020578098.1 phosphatidylinositol-glycan biosynthesis class F protein [Phalaenopsis equestris]